MRKTVFFDEAVAAGGSPEACRTGLGQLIFSITYHVGNAPLFQKFTDSFMAFTLLVAFVE
jgi:hypothetical protein